MISVTNSIAVGMRRVLVLAELLLAGIELITGAA